MLYREYGRTIEKIIEKVCATPESEERNEAARAIVTSMAQIAGECLAVWTGGIGTIEGTPRDDRELKGREASL